MKVHCYDEKTVARFWAKVNKNGPVPAHRPDLGACWIWTGSKDDGYGKIFIRDKNYKAHRFSAVLAGLVDSLNISNHGGSIGNSLILHHCDNRSCVRPEHFFVGNQKSNIAHAIAQGRFYQCKTAGEGHVNSKLSVQSVRMIRALAGKFSQAQIAKSFGVSQGIVSSIQRGESWKHVP